MNRFHKITAPLRLTQGQTDSADPDAKFLGVALISYTLGTFVERTTLSHIATSEFIGLHFNLGTKLYYKINGISGSIAPNHYNLLYIPATAYEYNAQKGRYVSLSIHYPLEYLSVVAENFPILQELINNANLKILSAASSKHVKCTAEMRQYIHEILYHHWPLPVRDNFLKGKLLDILLCCLKGIINNTQYPEQEKIEKAKDYIVGHLQDRFSPDLVAEKVGIEKHNLRKGFKELYKMSMLDFILNERMNKALAYLRNTRMPIHEIASRLGYKKPAAFSNTFKKKFGYYPTAQRKRAQLKQP